MVAQLGPRVMDKCGEVSIKPRVAKAQTFKKKNYLHTVY